MTFKFLILTFLVSCSFVSHEKRKDVSYVGVNLEQTRNTKITVKNQQTINSQQELNSEEPFGVFIGPGLYDTSYSIGVLKYLERKKKNINMISGNGLGAFIAFLYAYKGKVSLVEWEWFKFLSEIKTKERIYSQRWHKNFSRYLNKRFGKVKFSDLKKAFYIPLIDIDEQKVSFVRNKKVVPYIINSMEIAIKKGSQFKSAVLERPFPIEFFGEYRINEVLIINSIGEESQFDQLDLNYRGSFEVLKNKIMSDLEENHNILSIAGDIGTQDIQKRSLAQVKQGFLQSKQRLDDILDKLKLNQ